MDGPELLSLSASIASLVLAVIAIWLSIALFKMSSEASERTAEAGKGIGASVERLEKLFDKLYADTFSMMRDTVSDMRKHIWPDVELSGDKLTIEAETKADEKLVALKKSMEQDLAQMLRRQQITDEKITLVRGQMSELLDKAIASSRKVESEAREETIRERIVNQIRKTSRHRRRVTADEIVDFVAHEFEFEPNRVIDEMRRMKDHGVIEWSDDSLGPNTVIRLTG